MISNDFEFTFNEKFALFAIGRYFVFQYGISEKSNFSRKETEESTQIPEKTSISKIVNKLLDEKVILRERKGIYKINPFKIESKLNEIQEKHKIN